MSPGVLFHFPFDPGSRAVRTRAPAALQRKHHTAWHGGITTAVTPGAGHNACTVQRRQSSHAPWVMMHQDEFHGGTHVAGPHNRNRATTSGTCRPLELQAKVPI